jgi:hypothetical protein
VEIPTKTTTSTSRNGSSSSRFSISKIPLSYGRDFIAGRFKWLLLGKLIGQLGTCKSDAAEEQQEQQH